jgi:hypothetical protein
MSKPRFANKWYQTPPVNELRQEIQKAYDDLTAAEDDIDTLQTERVKNSGGVPEILAGAVTDTDADGNPTPNTTSFSPADYAEGTLFYATSYPANIRGSMQFQLVGGEWVWRWGDYRKFIASGHGYTRTASFHQTVWQGNFSGTTNSTGKLTWGFGVNFVSVDEYTVKVLIDDPAIHVAGELRGSSGAGSIRLWIKTIASGADYASAATGNMRCSAEGRWK